MATFILRRVAYSVFAMLAATVLVFTASRLQGDPRYLFLTGYSSEELWEAWGEEFGLNKPLVVQYFVWLAHAVRGDFGISINDARPVRDMIAERAPATFQLAGAAWLLALIVGIPLGVLSAVKRGSAWDYGGRTFALLGQALPPFWLGIMLILLFSVQLEWLPAGTRGGFKNLIMPAVVLAWSASSGNLRLMRSAMLEVLDSEYIKFARAKGVRTWAVVWKHAARNAILAPLTFAGIMLAMYLAGTVVTETVFAWPGLGRLAVDAVFANDFPVMTAVALVFTFIYLAINLLVDIGYAYVDPRIRYR